MCEPLPKHISKCHGTRPCSQDKALKASCDQGGWWPVCANGTVYRNQYCAQCNDLPDTSMQRGVCVGLDESGQITT